MLRIVVVLLEYTVQIGLPHRDRTERGEMEQTHPITRICFARRNSISTESLTRRTCYRKGAALALRLEERKTLIKAVILSTTAKLGLGRLCKTEEHSGETGEMSASPKIMTEGSRDVGRFPDFELSLCYVLTADAIGPPSPSIKLLAALQW